MKSPLGIWAIGITLFYGWVAYMLFLDSDVADEYAKTASL